MYKFFCLVLAVILQSIVLLGSTHLIGVANPEAWQAGAFLLFIASFLFWPPFINRG